jgi:hypothetical protein
MENIWPVTQKSLITTNISKTSRVSTNHIVAHATKMHYHIDIS